MHCADKFGGCMGGVDEAADSLWVAGCVFGVDGFWCSGGCLCEWCW